MKEVYEDEGRGENQRNPKNKVGELSDNQPSHSAISQKIADVNMDINLSLVTSSQKDVTTENSPQLGTQSKRGVDTTSPIKAYERKKLKTKPMHTSSHTS